VSNPSKDPVVIDKIKQTMLSKYGVEHINYINMKPESVAILKSKPQFTNFVNGLTVHDAAKKLETNESTIYRLSREYDCRSLMKIPVNSYELKITDFLDKIGVSYKTHNRQILAPKEIDIFLPDHNVGIEVGSLYHHGEQTGRGQFYHYDKWKKCIEKNITLFQWFDDELFDYWHLTSARLLRILGVNVPVVGARKIEISQCSVSEERDFLEYWHVKGFSNNRNTVLSGRYNGEIVAIMTINQKDNTAIIERWATNINISLPGLFSKMISQWLKTTGFSGKLSTWCDNRLGTGQVYNSSGFVTERVSKPGYWYFKNHGLENRQKYQKKKLINMFNLTGEDTLKSEWAIMQENGYDRVWDAGHTLWTKYIP